MRLLFLDIESSWNHDDNHPITWMSSCCIREGKKTFTFRYPEEVVEFYSAISEPTITYIHKIAFDMSYLKPYLQTLGDCEELKNGSHDYYYIRFGHHEFRDSWKLANCSLDKWGKIYGITHKKLVGYYNYNKIIYQDTDLTVAERAYMETDVLALQECVDVEMDLHHRKLQDMPLTSTGYVRQELKAACRDRGYREKFFRPIDTWLYRMALQSYSGGYTHLNRFYGGVLTEGHIVHRDFTSHYPTQMRKRKFPFGRQRKISCYDIPEILHKTEDGDWSILAEIRVHKARLRDDKISMPILQELKLKNFEYKNILTDNGRLLYTDGDFTIYVDNVRLKWIYEQYQFDSYEIVNAYLIKNEYMPEPICRVIDHYFKAKAELKTKKDINSVYAMEYYRVKKLLNAIYGCCATNPLKYSLGLDIVKCLHSDEELVQEVYEKTTKGLEKYFDSRNNFLNYLMGIYVTAYAMDELFEYIKLIGYDKVLYVDTDSIFYIYSEEIEEKIESLNRVKKTIYVTLDNGDKVYYDDFVVEETVQAFKGLHSKCYGVVADDTLHVTIAGIPETTNILGKDITREDELRIFRDKGDYNSEIEALDRLDNGLIFRVCTGTSATYITMETTIINVDGHEIHTAGGCIIKQLPEKEIAALDFV